MSEFIGSRISLISKSDIRYVGTLIEINSADSTVALENVTSFGTEGRRDNIADEVAPSDSVYEYIVFRGSDVKDLRIEEPPQENEPPQPPQVPNDPAILGARSRPPPHNGPPQQMQAANGFHPPPQYPPFQPQHYNQFPQQRFPGPPGGTQQGFQGPPGGFQGYPGPYGPPPPGWYPPPGQGFPHPQPGPFSPPHQQQHYGAPGQQRLPQASLGQTPTGQPLSGPAAHELESSAQVQNENKAPAVDKVSREPGNIPTSIEVNTPSQPSSSSTVPNPSAVDTPTAPPAAAAAPRPPVETKPDVASALAAPASSEQTKVPPTGPRSGRIIPAIPLASPAVKNAMRAPAHSAAEINGSSGTQYKNSTQAATAAVAAAMAKLPPAAGQRPKQTIESDGMDNLTRKVNEMRTDDRIRHDRQPVNGGYAANNRGGRGGPRRGGREQFNKPIEVPVTDFDFESANAKFNKHDLVKEATAGGSPAGTPADGDLPSSNGGDSTIDSASASMYSKSAFFDNISSEARDREDTADGKRAPGVQEFRSEERRRNFETFGQGSVDNGYRGGFRGRGRGRGFRGARGSIGYTGGGPRGGRGAYRGGQDGIAAAVYQGSTAAI